MNKVLCLSGPTASGKTNLSIEIAKQFNLSVVNFDSLCFYSELNIGTAKPTAEERSQCPHYLFDMRSAHHPLNAYDYTCKARPLLEKLLAENKTPLLVGGSGFYLRALILGMYSSHSTSKEIKDKVEKIFVDVGIEGLQNILEKEDKPTFEKLHANDHYRIKRAVEHILSTGRPISQSKDDFEKTPPPHDWEVLHLNLLPEKEAHLENILLRSHNIVEAGLIEEVEDLLKADFTGEEKPLNSIGYKEAQMYLKGQIPNKAELVEQINVSTRQLAKSQKTFFNKMPDKKVFNPYVQSSELIDQVKLFLHS